jgi:hypothetical protein
VSSTTAASSMGCIAFPSSRVKGGKRALSANHPMIESDRYRLCPLEKMPCTESEFQELPLEFVRDAQAVQWNNGSMYVTHPHSLHSLGSGFCATHGGCTSHTHHPGTPSRACSWTIQCALLYQKEAHGRSRLCLLSVAVSTLLARVPPESALSRSVRQCEHQDSRLSPIHCMPPRTPPPSIPARITTWHMLVCRARNPIPRIHTDNIGMAWVGKCLDRPACSQSGADYCNIKDDCQQFPSPCPDVDKGWWGGNATHMPTSYVPPDDNRHEGACSGDWTLGMISDEVVIPRTIKPGE